MIINFELTEYEIHIVAGCLALMVGLVYMRLLGFFVYGDNT